MLNISRHGGENAVTSQQVIKDRNTILLFNLIRKLEPISRAELARVSGLSPATVTVLTEELIKDQCIEEETLLEPRAMRGRRPVKLVVNGSRGYVFTLELLAQDSILSLYDIRLNKITSARYPNALMTPEEIKSIMLSLADSFSIDPARILGLHVLYPGLIEPENATLGFSTNIASDSFPSDLVPALQSLLPDVLVMLNNIATVIAYSVHVFHAPQARLPLLAMAVHEGMGSGVVATDGTCLPIEAGHTLIRPGGKKCLCGNRGCLETLCATPMLIQRVCEETDLTLRYDDAYGSLVNDDAVRRIRAALDEHDPAVCRVLSAYAADLATATVSITNLFGLHSVFFGGSLYLLGDAFLAMLREAIDTRFTIVTSTGRLSVGLFDDDCEISRKAAVMFVMERLFQRN